MANIPRSEVAFAADQAEAEQGHVILEEKNKKRVRYWWEEGYVPGNEKDSDDEKSESGSETKTTECEKQPDTNVLPSIDGEDSDYEVIMPGDAKGGRFVRWGGLHGRLCLADGDLALEDGVCETREGQKTLPPVQDYLDELLIPAVESPSEAESGAQSMLALENMPPAAAETMAIVLYQTPSSRVKPWSFCTITDNMSSKVDQAEVRKVFAIEDAERNSRLYSEEMQALSQMAIGNYFLRQQQGFEVVQKAKEDEAIRRRQVKEGSKEPLPGTKQPLAVSQAWQEHQGSAAAEPAQPKQRKTLLPGSLASSSSSSSFRPKEAMRKEPGPRTGGQKKVLPDAFDDSDFEPKFKIPEMPLSRRRYTPSHFDEAS